MTERIGSTTVIKTLIMIKIQVPRSAANNERGSEKGRKEKEGEAELFFQSTRPGVIS